MENKDLAEGVELIAEFSQEETKTLAQVFEENKGHPVSHAWDRIIKVKIKGYYYTLAHLPITDPYRTQKQIIISGKIQSLEELLNAPGDFIAAVVEQKEADEESKNV